MSKRQALGGVLVAGIVGLAAWIHPALAQPGGPPAPDYHPSLADLMTSSVQPRHIKLAMAGRTRNWPYLAYESSELRNAFNRIARTVPVYRKTQLADMFASDVMPSLDELDAAIKAKNPAKFDAAYGKVTQGCNACHLGLEHPYIVIRAPATSSYPDQDFAARKSAPPASQRSRRAK